MNIVYWSPMHGQTAVSSNALVTACITSLRYKKRVVITQTQYEKNNLEAPLLGSNANDSHEKERQNFFMDIGIDALTRNFKAAPLNSQVIEDCCVTLPNTNIMLLPGTTQMNKTFFLEETQSILPTVLKNTERFMDLLITDVSTGDNALSYELIQGSAVTVVNLSQNMRLIENYFKHYHKKMMAMSKKIFFLFGNYNDNSKYNINNIRRLYPNYIKFNNSGVIPSSAHFLDAMNDRQIVEFIKENIEAGKNDEQAFFIQKSCIAVEKILCLANIHISNDMVEDVDGPF